MCRDIAVQNLGCKFTSSAWLGRCVPAIAKLKAARALSAQVLTSTLKGGKYVLMRKLCVLNTLLNETNVVIPNTFQLLSLNFFFHSSSQLLSKIQPLTETRQMYHIQPTP